MKLNSAVSLAVGLAALFFTTQAQALPSCDVTLNAECAKDVFFDNTSPYSPKAVIGELDAKWGGSFKSMVPDTVEMNAPGTYDLSIKGVTVSANLTFDSNVKAGTAGELTLSWIGPPPSITTDIAVMVKAGGDNSGGGYNAYLFEDITLTSSENDVVWTVTLTNGPNNIPLELSRIELFVRDATTNAVPEPATMLLFGTGLLGLAGISRRKR